MTRFVLRRIAWALIVAWFVVTATFAMTTAIPAEPARALLGPHATPDAIAKVREFYCLDRGFVGRYACYVKNVASGDVGQI